MANNEDQEKRIKELEENKIELKDLLTEMDTYLSVSKSEQIGANSRFHLDIKRVLKGYESEEL